MELLEQMQIDDLSAIKEGDKVYVDAVLYSTKKHHGGRAIRQANTMGNAAATKKFNTALIRAAKAAEQLDDDFDWGEEEGKTSTEPHEARAYGHEGSTNKEVLLEVTLDFDEEGDMDQQDSNKALMVSNILNRCVQLRCGQNFDLSDRKQTYEQRKEALIKTYAKNGVIPAESKQAYLKALAGLAFIYYEHQVTVRIISNSPLNEQSKPISGSDGLYITYVKSVKWYGEALLSNAQIQDLKMPCALGAKIKVFTDLTVLFVRRNTRGKLYVSRRAEDPSQMLTVLGNSSEDDYS